MPTAIGVGALTVAFLVLAALVVVIAPEATAHSSDPTPANASTPVLSLRRGLGSLSRAAADAELAAQLDAFVTTLPEDSCLLVDAGGLAFTYRVDDVQSPASVHKLLIGTAALIALGRETRFETTVVADAVVDGVVSGDVYLVGGGDPLLSTAAYAARFPNQPQIFSDIGLLADAVAAAGVTEIRGSVIGDESRQPVERYNPLWPQRFINQDQIGPLSALAVNDGFVGFPVSGISGLDASGNPPADAAAVFTTLLGARGVTVTGAAAAGVTPVTATTVVATHSSPTVVEIVTEMLQESDNATAEILMRELAIHRGQPGTTAAGADAVAAILDEAGITANGRTIADGSGLALEDTLTCELVNEVLDYPPTATDLRNALAVVGVNGTLAKRWNGTDLVGKVRAKTGTLNQVSSLAGYIPTAAGDEAQFVMIANATAPTVLGTALLNRQQEMLELLAAYPSLADLSAFAPPRA